MKIKNFSVLILCTAFLFCCETENSDNLIYENSKLENQKSGPIYLAQNFDKQLSKEEAEKNAKMYLQLNHEEMAIFIEERYKMSLAKGTRESDADLAKDLMHEINDYLDNEYQESYASASPDQFLLAYETIIQNKNIESDQEINEKSWWGCSSWFRSGRTPVTGGSGTGIQQSLSFKGEFKLNGSGDCDFVYRSSPYRNSLTPKRIYGATSKSFAALTARGSNNNSSKEVAVGFTQKSFEFLIGKGRVLQAYGLFSNGQQGFANDTKILLY
ncbi:hypothetical protein [Aquimarina celericrescens]|uniref:DUF4848 domain-containing protein n=1 Tax=Aquimarina celericrescens TaxID=1964542 RepID=A0ABW5B401_9FLAO|nr:hypothetical protein [Aquimarina celericrescens]